jgi:hypothetical protein
VGSPNMYLRELIHIIIIIIIIIAFMYEKLRVPTLNDDFQEPHILKCVHAKVDCWECMYVVC